MSPGELPIGPRPVAKYTMISLKSLFLIDFFFSSSLLLLQALYNYYYHRGMIPIIGKGIVELVSLFFTLWLSVFLFAYLDWSELIQCTDEESCHASLSDYVIEKVCTLCERAGVETLQ